MPVLICPKCEKPFCVEPDEESLEKTIENLRVLMAPRPEFGLPARLLGCMFCGHRFPLEKAKRSKKR